MKKDLQLDIFGNWTDVKEIKRRERLDKNYKLKSAKWFEKWFNEKVDKKDYKKFIKV